VWMRLGLLLSKHLGHIQDEAELERRIRDA